MGTQATSIGSYAPDFEIPGVDGTVHHLARYLERFQAVGVIIMCNHCPYVRRYLDRLKQLQTELAGRVTLIGINANDEQQVPEDSFELMKTFATAHQLNFPYLRDLTQDVAQSFGATCTPQAFLVDRLGVVRYSGSIDDNADPAAVQQHYFKNAIQQLLADRTISCPETEAIGCSIKWRSTQKNQ